MLKQEFSARKQTIVIGNFSDIFGRKNNELLWGYYYKKKSRSTATLKEFVEREISSQDCVVVLKSTSKPIRIMREGHVGEIKFIDIYDSVLVACLKDDLDDNNIAIAEPKRVLEIPKYTGECLAIMGDDELLHLSLMGEKENYYTEYLTD